MITRHLVLAASVVMGAVYAIHALDPATLPLAGATAGNPSSMVPALVADSANPYRWADLAEAFAHAGQMDKARYAFQRALALSRDIPPILLRDANFHFQLDESDQALSSAARVLSIVPDYDSVLFNYFDRFVAGPKPVLAAIGDSARATTAYTLHLIGTGDLAGARLAWLKLCSRGVKDNSLTATYIDALLKAGHGDAAKQDWVQFLGPSAADYPASNLLYNGGFEAEPTGVALDWRIQPSTQYDVERDSAMPHRGKYSLRVTFHGDDNIALTNVLQTVLLKPGTYRLGFWIKTDGLTTNEGPRVEVVAARLQDRLLRTDPFLGTIGWSEVSQRFTVDRQTQSVIVRLVRNPSAKFDNKIAGTLWIDDLHLVTERAVLQNTRNPLFD